MCRLTVAFSRLDPTLSELNARQISAVMLCGWGVTAGWLILFVD